MKKWLQALVERIDGMVLRERVLLFVATMACILAVTDTWWLAPAQEEQKRLASNLRREDADLEQLRTQLRLLSAGKTGTGEQVDLAALREESRRLNQEIAALTADAKARDGLSQVLVQFLRQQEGLQLVRVATLPSDTLAGPPATPASGTGVAKPVPVVRAHRVELAISGPYFDLARYLRTLEQSLPKLHWGRMRLSSDNTGVAQLVVQVSYLEVAP